MDRRKTMTKLIKTVLLATAATAVIAAGPASARTRHHATSRVEATQPYSTMSDAGVTQYYGNDPYVVTDGARYLGRDPDLQIRSQILKDDTAYNGNGY
jgi:hypothetical protein